jgi:hypothetical protein
MELFEITPVFFGGSPTEAENKTWLTRQQHVEATRYWNRVIRSRHSLNGECPLVGDPLSK